MPDKCLAEHGREDRIHVTVLYGIHDTNVADTKKILSKVSPFTLRLGKVSLFTTSSSEFDVVKIEVSSAGLRQLNLLLRDNLKHTLTYKDFIPHVTIAYVKKGTCGELTGKTDFNGWTIRVPSLVFSSPVGGREVIPLYYK